MSLTMIEKLRVELSKRSAMAITSATFVDSTLALSGDGWSLSTRSAWRITRDGTLVCGWNDTAAEDRVVELSGQTIRDVAPQSRFMGGDPAFSLSSGEWLEIFSDQPTAPWTFHLPTMDFVGSPADYRHI